MPASEKQNGLQAIELRRKERLPNAPLEEDLELKELTVEEAMESSGAFVLARLIAAKRRTPIPFPK